MSRKTKAEQPFQIPKDQRTGPSNSDFKSIIETNGNTGIWIMILYQYSQHNAIVSVQQCSINSKAPELGNRAGSVFRKYKLEYLKINSRYVRAYIGVGCMKE